MGRDGQHPNPNWPLHFRMEDRKENPGDQWSQGREINSKKKLWNDPPPMGKKDESNKTQKGAAQLNPLFQHPKSHPN